jgi:hypothetical protein
MDVSGIYERGASTFAEMLDLPKDLRSKLEENFRLGSLQLAKELVRPSLFQTVLCTLARTLFHMLNLHIKFPRYLVALKYILVLTWVAVLT